MKISVKIVCRTGTLYKNNTAPLFIRLIQGRKTKYLSIGVAVNPIHWDFERSVLTDDCPERERIQQQIDAKLEAVNRQIAKFEILEIEPVLDSFGEHHRNRFNPLLRECFQRYIATLRQAGKINTSIKYAFTLSSIEKFRNGAKINDITLSFLQDFELFLRGQGNSGNTIATKMSTLKALYNKEERVHSAVENPFLKYKVGSLLTPTRKRAVTKETVKKLENLDLSGYKSPYVEFARDIFLFSYYTAGMNFRDIAFLTPENMEDNRIVYSRRKTQKTMGCVLIEPARKLMDKYLKDCSDNYIFPILNKSVHKTEQQIHNRLHKVLQKVNKHLKEDISPELGLKTPLTTYAARHTFASVLKRSGVNIAIISESLGHSDLATTQIYLDSFEKSQIDKAMENLL